MVPAPEEASKWDNKAHRNREVVSRSVTLWTFVSRTCHKGISKQNVHKGISKTNVHKGISKNNVHKGISKQNVQRRRWHTSPHRTRHRQNPDAKRRGRRSGGHPGGRLYHFPRVIISVCSDPFWDRLKTLGPLCAWSCSPGPGGC